MKKNILIGVTGSIAAYKACELVRLCIKAGHDVKVVMTHYAKKFIHPNTFAALTNHTVYDDCFATDGESMAHITLAKWADTIIIAPASAATICRLAHGLAEDLLTTLCLASEATCYIAPAMNKVMWGKTVTQNNINSLITHGHHIIAPDAGEQACGDIGEGRMAEPEAILQHVISSSTQNQINHLAAPNHRISTSDATEPTCRHIDAKRLTETLEATLQQHSAPSSELLKGLRILVTAGPTREAIDPVRYISNHSSGKMGYALAKMSVQLGATTVLITGPTQITPPEQCHVIHTVSAQQMHDRVLQHINDIDILICAAAVADHTPKAPATQKIKKHADTHTLALTKTPDILTSVTQQTPRPFTVGFCAETEHLLEHAQQKLSRKKLNAIVANAIEADGAPFYCDGNTVHYMTPQTTLHLPHRDKTDLAVQLLQLIYNDFRQQQPALKATCQSS